MHFSELLLRGVVAAAFLRYAEYMVPAAIFNLVGWVLLITTVLLALLPWPLHQRFAQRPLPQVLRHKTLMGVASLTLGSLVLAAVVFAPKVWGFTP